MKITIEPTTKIIELIMDVAPGRKVWIPARIWEGITDAGVPCHLYVTRVAVDIHDDDRAFQRALLQVRAPSPEIEALPARLVL